MASTFLTKTYGSDGNRDKWTYSVWVKRGVTGVRTTLYGVNIGVNEFESFSFPATDDLDWEQHTSGVYRYRLQTNRKFRDPGAWYHIVLVFDSLNVTAGDRMKMYINGVEETSFNVDTNPSSGYDSLINSTTEQQIGARGADDYAFDGEMSHIHFCDGYAYAASDFGEFDTTSGIWKIKTSPSVSYGTNGYFILKDGAGVTDQSPNSNNWTIDGTLTATKDNPSNNFSTLNSIANYWAGGTFSYGNTKWVSGGGGNAGYCVSNMGLTAGKWYCEVKPKTSTTMSIGITDKEQPDSSETPAQSNYGIDYQNDGEYQLDGGGATSFADSYTTDDIIGIYLDLDNNKFYVGKNGTVQNSGTGIAITGISAMTASTNAGQDCYFMAGAKVNGGSTFEFNFGNGYFGTTAVTSAVADAGGIGAFEYDPSAGTFDSASKDFRAICTKNIKAYGG